jgi:preprotein translocase subunit SecE
METVREAAGGRIERARLFLSEVRNELKRVTWPTRREVYATTIVVIIFSAVIGLYLFALDQALIAIVEWLFGFFGAA